MAWLEAQGPEIVQKYNKAMKEVFEEESEGEVWEGAWRSLEWYGVTEGVSPLASLSEGWTLMRGAGFEL